MATPQVIVQSGLAQLYNNSPGQLRVNTFNPDGTVLDVSTGYALEHVECAGSSQWNPIAGSQALSTHMSATFDTTGFTLKWTGVQATAMLAAIFNLVNDFYVFITNDSGTTRSLALKGTLNLDPLANLMA